MLVVTTDFIPNAAILETKGAVCSERVAAINAAKDVFGADNPTPILRNTERPASRRCRICSPRQQLWAQMPSWI